MILKSIQNITSICTNVTGAGLTITLFDDGEEKMIRVNGERNDSGNVGLLIRDQDNNWFEVRTIGDDIDGKIYEEFHSFGGIQLNGQGTSNYDFQVMSLT
jgi:hypothetical protein